VWSITEPVTGLTAELHPADGEISVVEPQQTGVIYALRGTTPYVTDGPRRAATITVPELIFTDDAQFEKLRLIRSLGRRVLLTDDAGTVWPSKFVGPTPWRVLNTPDRATKPIRYVKITLVGVA
jgi:hypothetical protein